MKLPKLDFSKEGMGKLWLHHAEKFVLAAALGLLGLFAWFGFSTPRFTGKSPGQVVELARQAEKYINTPESWNQIQNFRKAETEVVSRIKSTADAKLNAGDYRYDLLVGPLVKTLLLRTDPELRPVEELVARSGTFPIFYPSNAPDELNKLVVASTAEPPKQEKQEKTDNKKDYTKKVDKPDPFAPGKALPSTQLLEIPGVRRTTYKASGEGAGVVVQDVVSVTGLIPYESQFAEHQRALIDAQGYYPARDVPLYRTLQIQRREESGEWVEITAQVLADANLFAVDQESFVPDYIDPKYYLAAIPGGDPITGAIPPIVLTDYREFVGHPKVPLRQMVPTSLKREFSLEEEQIQVNRDPLAGEKFKSKAEIAKERQQEENQEIQKIKTRADYDRYGKRIKPAAPYKLVRFFDLRAPKGKRVQYRVRLWLPDPNDPDVLKLSDKKEAGGEGGEKRDQPGMGMGGMDGGGAEESNQSTPLEEDGVEQDIDLKKATKIAVEPRMLDGKVLERLARKRDDSDMPQNAAAYKHLIPTPWSNETDPVLVGGEDFRVFAGKLVEPAPLRIDGVKIPKLEPSIAVAASVYSRKMNAVIPAVRPEARRAEMLNFTAPKAHVLNPKDGTVRVYPNAEIETDSLIVDMQGGEKLDIRGSKLEYFAPAELLVMDAEGKFHLQNEFSDYRQFRHALFREDESVEVGRKRTRDRGDEKNNQGGGDQPPDR